MISEKGESRSEHVGVAQSPPCPKYTTRLVNNHEYLLYPSYTFATSNFANLRALHSLPTLHFTFLGAPEPTLFLLLITEPVYVITYALTEVYGEMPSLHHTKDCPPGRPRSCTATATKCTCIEAAIVADGGGQSDFICYNQ